MQQTDNATPCKKRAGFTLVELLVVIGVIALLISILLPALGKAQKQARKVKCLANLKQIGMAFAMYTNDNKGWYPVHGNWGNCMGKVGIGLAYDNDGPSGFENDPGIIKIRPLNPYLTPKVCECPLDIGDTLSANVFNCFQNYGTSYLVEWKWDDYGVSHVTNTALTAADKPMKSSVRGDSSKKIICADWNWHGNRSLNIPRTLWHGTSDPAVRRLNVLFMDGHAEDFAFPAVYETLPQVTTPDVARGFW